MDVTEQRFAGLKFRQNVDADKVHVESPAKAEDDFGEQKYININHPHNLLRGL